MPVDELLQSFHNEFMEHIPQEPEEKIQTQQSQNTSRNTPVVIIAVVIGLLCAAIIGMSIIADGYTADTPDLASEKMTNAVPVRIPTDTPVENAKNPRHMQNGDSECRVYGAIPEEELYAIHHTEEGDTFNSIAHKYYGTREYGRKIREVNPSQAAFGLDDPLDEWTVIHVPPDVLVRSSESLIPMTGKITEVADTYITVNTGGSANTVTNRYYVSNSLKNPRSTGEYNIAVDDCVIVITNSSHTISEVFDQDEF